MRQVTLLIVFSIVLLALPSGFTDANADDTHSDDDRTCIRYERKSGTCTAWSSSGVGGDTTESSAKAKAPPHKCYSPSNNAEIPCRTKDGYWSSVYHCYLKPYTGSDATARAKELDVGKDEMLATCTRATGDQSERMQIIVIPRSDATPPPDPRTVAWELVAKINITAGQIGLVPDSDHAMVGLPTWLWVDDPGRHTTGPVSESATVAGHTITIEAALSAVTYDMGDGTTVTCDGAAASGTRYLERYGIEPSPNCGHWYEEPGNYVVTAHSQWTITWYGVGQAGTFTFAVQRSLDLRVAEGHSVVR